MQTKNSKTESTTKNFLEVYTIVDRGEDKKAWWCRCGTCFLNKDGSFNVILDALPTNGRLNIREPSERE